MRSFFLNETVSELSGLEPLESRQIFLKAVKKSYADWKLWFSVCVVTMVLIGVANLYPQLFEGAHAKSLLERSESMRAFWTFVVWAFICRKIQMHIVRREIQKTLGGYRKG